MDKVDRKLKKWKLTPQVIRHGRVLQINLKHIQIKGSHLEALFPKSKTDQHRDGHIVYVSGMESDCCPVKTLKKF